MQPATKQVDESVGLDLPDVFACRTRNLPTGIQLIIAGSGGPSVYEGKDMLSAHKGMNTDNDEFVAVLDDALEALDKNGIGQREKEEVLAILEKGAGLLVT